MADLVDPTVYGQGAWRSLEGSITPPGGPPVSVEEWRTANQPGRFNALEMAMALAGGPRSGRNIIRRHPGMYDVHVGDKFAGTASVAGEGTKPFVSVIDILPQYRRQGIGTEVYRTIENDLGRPLVPSPLGLSKEATAFWQKRLAAMPIEEQQKLLSEARAIGQGYGISDAHLATRLDPLRPGAIAAQDQYPNQ